VLLVLLVHYTQHYVFVVGVIFFTGKSYDEALALSKAYNDPQRWRIALNFVLCAVPPALVGSILAYSFPKLQIVVSPLFVIPFSALFMFYYLDLEAKLIDPLTEADSPHGI